MRVHAKCSEAFREVECSCLGLSREATGKFVTATLITVSF